MSETREDLLPTLAALLVLFTALLDPLVSLIIAGASILGLVLYTLRRRRAAPR
jgi:hypothetical protein